MADPFCKCGHRRSDHLLERSNKYGDFYGECLEEECECEQYEKRKAREDSK